MVKMEKIRVQLTCIPFSSTIILLVKLIFKGKIRFVPPQLREIGCHVQNHATQWHGFQHEIQLQEIVVAWIKMTLSICEVTVHMVVLQMGSASGERMHAKKCRMHVKKDSMCKNGEKLFLSSCFLRLINHPCNI